MAPEPDTEQLDLKDSVVRSFTLVVGVAIRGTQKGRVQTSTVLARI